MAESTIGYEETKGKGEMKKYKETPSGDEMLALGECLSRFWENREGLNPYGVLDLCAAPLYLSSFPSLSEFPDLPQIEALNKYIVEGRGCGAKFRQTRQTNQVGHAGQADKTKQHYSPGLMFRLSKIFEGVPSSPWLSDLSYRDFSQKLDGLVPYVSTEDRIRNDRRMLLSLLPLDAAISGYAISSLLNEPLGTSLAMVLFAAMLVSAKAGLFYTNYKDSKKNAENAESEAGVKDLAGKIGRIKKVRKWLKDAKSGEPDSEALYNQMLLMFSLYREFASGPELDYTKSYYANYP